MKLRTPETEKQFMIAGLEASFEQKKADCLKKLELQLQCSVCKQGKDRIVELSGNHGDPFEPHILICEQCVKDVLALYGNL